MLRNMYCWLGVLVGLLAAGPETFAQGAYPLTDQGETPVTRTFTNSVGTASTTNGTMIVFEGQLDSSLGIEKEYNAYCDAYLASVQLLIQIKLFDELPLSNELANVQGAVAALRDSAGSSNGTYYAWGSTNGSAMTWLPLKTTNDLPFTVTDGGTNYVTFVFSYPTVGAVTYQVFVGQPLIGGGKGDMVPSEHVTSLTAETDGINSLSLLGAGVVQEIGTSNGEVTPLSTSIDLSVYFSSNSVFADVATVNENGSKSIRIYARINGVWTLVGVVPADSLFGEGDHLYRRIALHGLKAGQSYEFQIVDESDHVHAFANVPVETVTIGSAAFVKGAMQTLEVTFNTTEGRTYQVKVCDSLAASADKWKDEFVSQYKGAGVWGESTTNGFMAGPGAQTQIRIPVIKSKAFFRIFRLDGE